MRAWIVAGIVAVAGFWAVPAHAVLFDLSSCAQAGLPATCNNSDSGHTSLTYSLAGVTMGASAAQDFDLKVAGPGETGLGLFPQIAHEIGVGDVVTLDFSDLADRGATGGILTISSLQSGEVGTVTDFLGAHPAVESDGTQTDDVTIAFNRLFPTVTVTAENNDVLVASEVSVVPSITPIPIPEPSSAGLASLAFLAAMLVCTASALKYQDG